MDKRIREGIEACRPGSDDLLDPQLADVAQAIGQDADARAAEDRVQKWDVAIASALEQVPVPAGLAERLLARLQTAVENTNPDAPALLAESATAAQQVPGVGEDAVDAPLRRSIWQRRHWAGASLAAIAAAVLVIAAGYWMQVDSDLPLDQLAARWHEELTNDWHPAERAPSDFPVGESLRVPPTRWQWIGQFTPTRVVAYELVQGQTKAMLYVARMTRSGLRSTPPSSPQMDTAGRAIGYWRSGENVYVLVVPDVRNYRAFVRPSTAPLAIVLPLERQRQPSRLAPILDTSRKIA